jgi:transketolase N-terminal domain/subunit
MIIVMGLGLIAITMLYKGGITYQSKDYKEAIDWFILSIGYSTLAAISCVVHYYITQ